jgi:hypothetical protein
MLRIAGNIMLGGGGLVVVSAVRPCGDGGGR